MINQVGKKQCSISGRKQNDIAPLESDFMVQPPSLLEFPGPLTPHPLGISNSLRGGGLDISWNHTLAVPHARWLLTRGGCNWRFGRFDCNRKLESAPTEATRQPMIQNTTRIVSCMTRFAS